MAFQPSVVEYFNSRKRPAVDDLKKSTSAKVLVVENELSERNEPTKVETNQNSLIVKKIAYTKNVTSTLPIKKTNSTKNNKCRSSKTTRVKIASKSIGNQSDIRKSLFKPCKLIEEKNSEVGQGPENPATSKDEAASTEMPELERPEQNVPFHIKGPLSPIKSRNQKEALNEEKPDSESSNDLKSPDKSTSNARKDLNLGRLKAIMSRSSRLEEMKAALQRFNENKAKLNETPARAEVKPSLEGFDKFSELASPLKTPTKVGHFTSPQGKLTPSRLFDTPPPPLAPSSPLKSPLKSPAFQRYQALVTEGRPTLSLPFKYRALAELFRCVDTVASMLHNRRETITLSKLRPGVQEISRKNLTEYHLGQIKTVFPGAFDFSQEKMRALGSAERYELVVKPHIAPFTKGGVEGEGKEVMGPSVLLARRRALYNALLELAKDHHEEFLRSLEPPMVIPRGRLTRWHPEFPVDEVPDVFSASLPQPPQAEKVTSAKEVLERAHSLFVVNPRMERALKKVSENSSGKAGAPSPASPSPSPTTPGAISDKRGLHGVPASLLERVRAKQAARALEAMTRTPAEAKEAIRITRLPEMARIIRNLFVAEKKSVLPRETVLRKLADSYRESLTDNELDDHVKLLSAKTPGWMTFCNLRKTDYVKLSREADMSRIMARLEALAVDKCV